MSVIIIPSPELHLLSIIIPCPELHLLSVIIVIVPCPELHPLLLLLFLVQSYTYYLLLLLFLVQSYIYCLLLLLLFLVQSYIHYYCYYCYYSLSRATSIIIVIIPCPELHRLSIIITPCPELPPLLLFLFLVQSYIPDPFKLRGFVSTPPPGNERLFCTMIRHGDETSGGHYTLYLEYLSGLVPLLKGKRASKLRPDFVIFDPKIRTSGKGEETGQKECCGLCVPVIRT